MAGGPRGSVHHDLDRMFHQGTVAGLGDDRLLLRFVTERDEHAFEALVARHGPMVLGVCRRMLGDPHSAADAFQATFLVLLRKAASLRTTESLGPWLHGVAYRVAARARADVARRRDRERRGARARSESVRGPAHAIADLDNPRAVLDAEIARLPERYRRAIILCYLEGQTHEEAARRLRCTAGMLRGRLDRGRERLRTQLARRGLAPAVALGTVLAAESAPAAVPEALKLATAGLAAGRAAASASAAVITLANLISWALSLSRLKLPAALLAGGALCAAAATLAWGWGMTPEEPTAPGALVQPVEGPARARDQDGLVITGRVLDRQGRPIAGARVGQGSNRQEGPTPEAMTDAEGRFVFRGVAPAPLILTVQARGYGPELKSVVAGPASEPVEFRLGPGRSIRGRIVDLTDKPIAGAPVSAAEWRGHRSLTWRSVTDADGRYRWEDAPIDEVLVDIGALGYTSKRYMRFEPAEGDWTMPMPRPRLVRGSVTDAETGKPIKNFTILIGHSGAPERRVEWEYNTARSLPDGSHDYEVKLGAEYRDFVRYVRVEADGYLPARSRAFMQDEDEWDHTFDFKLRRGDGIIRGLVHQPDESPLAGADVMVLTSAGPIITNGQPLPDQFCRRLKTGPDGRFAFPLPESPCTVVVLHDRGFAERTSAQLATSGDMTIEPWGRIEGTYRVGGRPGSGASLVLTPSEGGRRGAKTYYGGRAATDATGRFVFERVHPGEVAVARPFKTGSMTTIYPLSEPIKVSPGATVHVAIGGTGRPIVGRVDVPAALTGRIDWTLSTVSLLPQRERQIVPVMKLKPDGSFRLDDVPAGTYQLHIIAKASRPDPEVPPLDSKTIGSARREITIPEMAGGRSDEPLDLGTIALESVER